MKWSTSRFGGVDCKRSGTSRGERKTVKEGTGEMGQRRMNHVILPFHVAAVWLSVPAMDQSPLRPGRASTTGRGGKEVGR